MIAVSIVDKWFGSYPDERGLRDTLAVSGLSSAPKAKKRAELAQQLQVIMDVHFETELRIGREEKMNEEGARQMRSHHGPACVHRRQRGACTQRLSCVPILPGEGK